MPRRFLATRQKAQSAVGDRLRAALVYNLERPNVEQLMGSQDQKLLLVKSSVMVASLGGPPKLIAGPPEMQKPQVDLPSPGIPIISEPNPFADLTCFNTEHDTANSDIDFTKAEDFFQLETQIDVRKDHSILKIALTSPENSFLSNLISEYTIPSHRLAFIKQNTPNSLSSVTTQQPNSFIVGPTGGQDNKEYIVSCQGCGEMFTCLNKFQRHILMHPDPESKKFLCQICGKRFNRADHLNRHSVLHGDVAHKCLLCGEEFDRASHLDRHRRKNHPPAGQDPSQTPPTTPSVTCPPTEYFQTTSSINNDTTSIGTNLHLLAAVATPEDSQELTPNQILQLEASRVVSEILVNEVNTAQNKASLKKPLSEVERPFVCDVCDRKFIRSTHLRRHMRIHTGEKPFACHICGRKYARGDYLRAHIQGHRRDRVHKCKHCNEVFHDLTRFANHCRVVHQDIDEESNNRDDEQPIVIQHVQDMGFTNEDIVADMDHYTEASHHNSSSQPSSAPLVHHKGINDDISLTAAAVPPHFAPDLLQVFNTTTADTCPSSASTHQPDSNVILQNGSLSMSESENDVNGVLAGKVNQSQMLETLTQFFITAGTGSFLGPNEQSHT